MSNKLTLLLCALCCCGMLNAQSIWTDVSERGNAIGGDRYIIPQQYRTLRLDVAGMQSLLSAVPAAESGGGIEITLPMPDGSNQRFRLYETPVMAPELQARYPEIRCYSGRGIEDPAATLKCDLTPWGFHAMVSSRQTGAVFIDPYAHGNSEYYIAYFKKDFLSKGKNAQFSCGLEAETADNAAPPANAANTAVAEFQGDCQLRTYRLALACTGEYANFHGGTKPLVLAAMNTSMNRVNGLYENDLAVTMQLIPNNDTLIFLTAGTDPYSNNNGGTMLNQNVTTCNERIGSGKYDIGHVFSTGGGGIAGLGVVCSSQKARGVTGSGTPIGDPFDIDYVAHEMGHQFGANHTQNNNCNNVNGVAMEPGSASTIMGYAGICAPDVQNNSDDYFHAISLQEIGLFITTDDGNTCPVKTVTGNNSPTVNAGANHTIPKSTPFALTAVSSDSNDDGLTFCWEQMDPQFATMPPVSTSASGPMFRSYAPDVSPTRYFPRLADLVNNINSTWEELPGVARSMNFRVTARDNNSLGGCTEEDDVVLTVAATAGPFVVTEPNTNVLWYVGDSKTITWNVTNTNVAPVNCSNVRILLSTDGGFTYPVVLADNVANSGMANILVPDNVSNTCRVKVEAIGNVFFDISNQNFRIQQSPVPSFNLSSSVETLNLCAGADTSFTVSTNVIAGFEGLVNLSISGAPAGALANIAPAQIDAAAGSTTVSISGLTPGMAGSYKLIVTGVSGTIQKSDTIALTIYPGAPAVASPIAPANGSSGQALTADLFWDIIDFATSYTVQVSESPLFTDFVYNQTSTASSTTVPGLSPGNVYYWRVQSANLCGEASFSEPFAFQVQNLQCDQTFSSTDVPAIIDDQSVNTALSVLNVPGVGVIGSIQVNIQATHSWVGDLKAVLSTPWNQDIILFDRPGVPASQYGCDNSNLNISFSNLALLDANVLEDQCNNNSPALSGTFQPIQSLADLSGQGAGGEWRLSITDNVAEDGGSITAWSLNFCFLEATPAIAFVQNNTLSVPQGGNGGVSDAYLKVLASASAAQVRFTLTQIPQNGSLTLNGNALVAGSTFTQADIDANLLVYIHNGNNSLSDNFYFDVLDQNNAAWSQNNVFSIQVIQNNLNATASAQQISCHNGSNGVISVTASGLDGNFAYSLNGNTPQNTPVFSALPAGTYSVQVIGQFGLTYLVENIVLQNPAVLELSAAVLNDVVTVTASGGTGALEYSLDGQNFQSNPVFNNVANGIYTLTVRDANNCLATAQAIVAFNSLIAQSEVTSEVSCFGGSNGSISVNAGGGEAPLEYSLNGIDFQLENVFTDLTAGTYTVTVRDAGTLTTTTNEIVIGQPDLLSIDATVDINDISIAASGGTAPYTYSMNDQPVDSTSFENLEAGIYTFVVTDANGCTATAAATALGNTLTVGFIGVADVSCFGDSDGLLGLCINGGYGALTATINPPAGIYNPSQENCHLLASYSALPVGEYTVTITDSLGFFTTAVASIHTPEPLELSVSNLGDTIFASVTGGTFSYEYSLDGVNWQPSPEFSGLADGLYTVYARDIKRCTDSVEFLLNTIKTIDLSATWGLSVSPNPGAGLFRLHLLDAPAALQVDVVDMTGRSLRRLDFAPGGGNFSGLIDLQELAQGIYVLRMTDGTHTGAVRLSIVR